MQRPWNSAVESKVTWFAYAPINERGRFDFTQRCRHFRSGGGQKQGEKRAKGRLIASCGKAVRETRVYARSRAIWTIINVSNLDDKSCSLDSSSSYFKTLSTIFCYQVWIVESHRWLAFSSILSRHEERLPFQRVWYEGNNWCTLRDTLWRQFLHSSMHSFPTETFFEYIISLLLLLSS